MNDAESREEKDSSIRNEAVENLHPDFSRKKQLRHLLTVSLSRWLLTAALVASIYGILWHYASRRAITAGTKRVFNALITGFSIGLGLNLASSLKHMAREIRWWVLSLHEWSVQEAGLVLQLDDLSHVTRLVWESTNFQVRIYACLWLLINAAFQIGVAALGLTYTVSAVRSRTITKPGPVMISNMTTVETAKVIANRSQTLSALRYTANNHGTIALAFVWGNISDAPPPCTLWDPDLPQMFCGDNFCNYYFYESTPDYMKDYIAVTTNRHVQVTGDCNSWRVTSGGDGLGQTITVDDDSHSVVSVPVQNGPDQTVYMVDTDQSSNTPWSIVEAFEASSTNPWYYRCNVSFGPVINAVRKDHDLGTSMTSLASSAIALQGYGASSSGTGNSQQFQSYPAETWYGEAQNGSTDGMGLLMARFSTGVLVVTALANSVIMVPGMQPQKGVSMDITDWTFVHLILGLTLGLQLFFAVLVACVATKVRVRDDSHWTMAVLLRDMLQRLDRGAVMATRKEIVARFDRSETLRYTLGNEGVYHVRLRGRSRRDETFETENQEVEMTSL